MRGLSKDEVLPEKHKIDVVEIKDETPVEKTATKPK